MRRSRLLATWIVGGYVIDVLVRTKMSEYEARRYCDGAGKPLLNVGSGTRWSSLAAFLMGPSRVGDVNLDIAATGSCKVERGSEPCQGDAHDLSRWPDKFFGAVVANHVLEHLGDPDRALAEWSRVADRLYVVTPHPLAFHTWAHPGHRSVFWGASGSPLQSGPWKGSGPRTPLWPAPASERLPSPLRSPLGPSSISTPGW